MSLSHLFSPYLVYLLTIVALYIIFGLSFNLLAGFTGMSNLGQPAFFLVGAYTTVLLQMKLGVPPIFALLGGALAGFLIGALFSLVTRKARGDAVAVLGMWFMFISVIIALNWISVTRGALGIPGIPQPHGWETPDRFLLLMAAMAGILYLLVHRITSSPFGRVLGAIRDDELVAQTLGKNAFKARVLAFALSGAIAGLGGGMFAYFFRFIDPGSFFVSMLVALLTIVYVGGLASLPGTVVGALIVGVLPEILRLLPFNPEIVGGLRQIIFSVLVLLVILFRPRGVLGKVEL